MSPLKKDLGGGRFFSLPLIFLTCIFCVAGLIFLVTSGLDDFVQTLFFDPLSQKWMLSKSDEGLRLLFYKGPKILLATFGVLLLLGTILYNKALFWRKVDRKAFVYLLLCLMIIPASISLLKAQTNVYCPGQLEIFGGRAPEASLAAATWGQKSETFNKGRCFPAGHASGGFALMALYFVFQKPRHRIMGFSIGVTVGWLMGGYQIVKGDHFVSHTLVSMLIALLIATSLARLFMLSGTQNPKTVTPNTTGH